MPYMRSRKAVLKLKALITWILRLRGQDFIVDDNKTVLLIQTVAKCSCVNPHFHSKPVPLLDTPLHQQSTSPFTSVLWESEQDT